MSHLKWTSTVKNKVKEETHSIIIYTEVKQKMFPNKIK